MQLKNAELPGEPHAPARIVIVDPRRTVTVNACEVEAGRDNVLHLAIESGTDLVLFNALLTHVADQGWLDDAFIEASTEGFADTLAANRTSLEEAAAITGLTPEQIRTAARWIAEPKDAGGARRRTMFAYEKGLIWGNDNLPDQRRAGEFGAGHRQCRPPGRRLRAHGRSPGGLCPAARGPCRPARRLCRPAPDRGRRRPSTTSGAAITSRRR